MTEEPLWGSSAILSSWGGRRGAVFALAKAKRPDLPEESPRVRVEPGSGEAIGFRGGPGKVSAA